MVYKTGLKMKVKIDHDGISDPIVIQGTLWPTNCQAAQMGHHIAPKGTMESAYVFRPTRSQSCYTVMLSKLWSHPFCSSVSSEGLTLCAKPLLWNLVNATKMIKVCVLPNCSCIHERSDGLKMTKHSCGTKSQNWCTSPYCFVCQASGLGLCRPSQNLPLAPRESA